MKRVTQVDRVLTEADKKQLAILGTKTQKLWQEVNKIKLQKDAILYELQEVEFNDVEIEVEKVYRTRIDHQVAPERVRSGGWL